jgi:glycosyltransferase involved in cell wall biosynthesis
VRPLQVAHVGSAEVHPLHRLGGATQRRIVETASRQAQLGYEVAVYAAGQDNMVERLKGFELRTVRCLASGPVRRLEFLVRATADLRRRRPGVVHFHGIPEGAVAMRGICPTVLQYDYYIFMRGRLKGLYRRALRKFDRLLPVSRYCRRAAIDYWDIPQVPNEVLYNGVNAEQFSPDPAAGSAMRARFGIGDAPVMLYVGRVCEQKGTDTLLGAYELLRARVPRARLVVAGPPGQFGLTGGIPLTSRIEQAGGLYLGAVDESDLSAVYNMCDVFVMPTREYEMFGMAAAEAQACGKPVVCTRHGGLVEVISERSGRYFTPGDAHELAGTLEALLTDRATYQELAFEARRNAMRFAWPVIVDRLDRIYGEITGREVTAQMDVKAAQA